jgi:hypothetical protein
MAAPAAEAAKNSRRFIAIPSLLTFLLDSSLYMAVNLKNDFRKEATTEAQRNSFPAPLIQGNRMNII